MLEFRPRYFILTILLLAIEIIIALFVHDNFVRPNVGDFLVVILIYCFVQSFFKLPVVPTTLLVLLFAYCVEMLQYLQFIKWVGLQNSRLANVILGNSFQWADILAYTLGAIAIIWFELKFGSMKK